MQFLSKLFLKSYLFIGLWLLITPSFANLICSAKDLGEIRAAISHYLTTETAISPDQVVLIGPHCLNGYASGKLHPTKPITDDAIIYLHKVKNDWQVMSLGTDFDTDFLTKIPKQLRY